MLADDITFSDYFKATTEDQDKFYHNYLGIVRKEFPKWQGWKIINEFKENGISVKEIKDATLDMHVRNFYYLKLIQETY